MWQQGRKLQQGKYCIEKKLGEGGFGIVYKAKQIGLGLDNWVVIKTPNPLKKKEPKEYIEIVRRFKKEARNLSKLIPERHPNIVRVRDSFLEKNLRWLFWQEDVPCLVMDFLEGENLEQRVKRLGALSEEEVVGYIRQIGEALSVIHSKYQLVHRDVKPSNIMLPRPGEAILIDFGIVGGISPDKKSSIIMGTRHFAAPEQLNGTGGGPTVDIYALAASCYYGVTGRIPEFKKLILPKQLNSHISDRLIQAIRQGMAPWPEDRPQTMAEWLELLDSTSSSNISTFSSPTVQSTIPSTLPSESPSIPEPQEQLTTTITETIKVEEGSAPRQKERLKGIVKNVKQLLHSVYPKRLGWFNSVMVFQVFAFAGFFSVTTQRILDSGTTRTERVGADYLLWYLDELDHYGIYILYFIVIYIILKLYFRYLIPWPKFKNKIYDFLLFFLSFYLLALLLAPSFLFLLFILFISLVSIIDIVLQSLKYLYLVGGDGLLIKFLLVWAVEWVMAWRMKWTDSVRVVCTVVGAVALGTTISTLASGTVVGDKILIWLWQFVVYTINFITLSKIKFKHLWSSTNYYYFFIVNAIQYLGFRLGWLIALGF